MSGFVQHGPGEFCPVMTRPGELPIEPDGTNPTPAPDWPASGDCRNCGRWGVIYETPPLDPAQADLAERFARWFGGSLAWDLGVREPYAPLHKDLFDLHARVEVVVLAGNAGAAPVTAQQCRECGGDGWPCKTLRVMAEWHKGVPGWDERWSA
ncbi:hypothetical protein ACIHFD_49635 [Nonomuraea sp. NPDC051941]|uniref:hypothetical protein n=1 Tax=Nonomuraea sp. NPDC051941 TaxID=3364373 RepID=UPI0037C61084